MSHKIAVVGQGVMGLTSASKLLDRGFHVTLFSKEPFEQTTSMSAGAYWWPHRTYPADRVYGWAKTTYEEYARESSNPKSGVHFEPHLRFCLDPDDSSYVLQCVGLRPGRHAVRLELELNDRGQAVLHNYGHGGGGFTVAWGCANEVATIAHQYFA